MQNASRKGLSTTRAARQLRVGDDAVTGPMMPLTSCTTSGQSGSMPGTVVVNDGDSRLGTRAHFLDTSRQRQEQRHLYARPAPLDGLHGPFSA